MPILATAVWPNPIRVISRMIKPATIRAAVKKKAPSVALYGFPARVSSGLLCRRINWMKIVTNRANVYKMNETESKVD